MFHQPFFTSRLWRPAALLGLSALASSAIWLTAEAQVQPPPPPTADSPPREALSQDDVEVLTRGPVHEAFAEPLSEEPEPGLVVPKKPPEDIDELAPDFKPDGDDVIWIPGYWAWDDDRDDYLWVSGIWRKLPPGRRWIPGYWLEVPGGWQWVGGLWTPDEEEELVYRQPPPQTLESGPNVPAPSDAYFWVPGCWVWYDVGYRWRPGYWHPYQENWVWVPAHWVWTPSGFLFVPGYWDHRVSLRGQLFAPVYFRNTVWVRTHYYSPWCVVESTPLLIHFWVRPRYCHYYFGDYYGPRYATWGLTPWSHWHSRPSRWDPLLTHYHVHYRHRDHFDYTDRMRKWHSYYDRHDDERPRRTFRDQERFTQEHRGKASLGVQQSALALRLDAAAKRTDNVVAFKPVSQERKKSFFDDSRQLRELTRERSKSERFAKFDRRDDNDKGDRRNGGPDRDKDKPTIVGKDGVPDATKLKPADTKPADTKKDRDAGDTQIGDKLRDAKKDDDDRRKSGKSTFRLPKASSTAAAAAAAARKSEGDGRKAPPQITTPKPIDPKDLVIPDRSKIGSAGAPGSKDLKGRDDNKPDRGTGRSRDDDKDKSRSKPSRDRDDDAAKQTKPKTVEPKPAPKIETPKVTPPKIEKPKSESPKIEKPKFEPPKKVEKPRSEPKPPPKVESPRPSRGSDNPPKRSESPRRGDDDKPKRDRK